MMGRVMDFEELLKNMPPYYYNKEVRRAQERIEHHNTWLAYFKKKIKKLNELKRGSKKNGRST